MMPTWFSRLFRRMSERERLEMIRTKRLANWRRTGREDGYCGVPQRFMASNDPDIIAYREGYAEGVAMRKGDA